MLPAQQRKRGGRQLCHRPPDAGICGKPRCANNILRSPLRIHWNVVLVPLLAFAEAVHRRLPQAPQLHLRSMNVPVYVGQFLADKSRCRTICQMEQSPA